MAFQGAYVQPLFILAGVVLLGTLGAPAVPLRAIDLVPAAFVATALVSLLWGRRVDGDGGLYSLVVIHGVGAVAYYMAAFGPFRDSAGRVVLQALLRASIAVSAFGFADLVLNWRPWGDPLNWSMLSPPRVIGMNPSVLGMMIGAGVVIAIAVLAWNGPSDMRREAWAALALGLPILVATFTRTPLIAAVAVAAALLLLRSTHRWRSVYLIGFLALGLVAGWTTISASDVYETRVAERDNVEFREEMMAVSIRAAEHHPAIGWGYGTFDTVKELPEVQRTGTLSLGIDANTSHNTFLTILVETGLIGLSLFLLPWVVLGAAALRQVVRQPARPGRWALIAALAVMAVWILNATGIDMRFFSFGSALGWLAVGVLRRTLAEPWTG
jgi:O-antigen ligase